MFTFSITKISHFTPLRKRKKKNRELKSSINHILSVFRSFVKGVPFKKIEARKRFHFYFEKNEKFSRVVEICHVLGNASLESIKFQARRVNLSVGRSRPRWYLYR